MNLLGVVITRIIQEVTGDPIGITLQILTILLSLLIAFLYSRKGLERYGYLLSFVTLPVWVAEEWWYKEWCYFFLNPVYFIVFWIGLKNHWKVKK
jgi:hypothetical protein